MNPSQEDLKKWQYAIYLERVERARKMTPEERLDEFHNRGFLTTENPKSAEAV